ncbi:CLUMA_CG013619, isoform A [Clunio marinus]|uniref:Zinc finger protein ZPR1 n=1 Tax=Clunio marinus TaxID=568069 RepID=A0A1J1IKQ5_9DIPT|nr:CLUMA_CG013619, isoform A [Clunio marinus]
MSEAPKPIYLNLSADDPDLGTTEIESMCMNCHKNGTTRLLLTKIPFYKEIVLMSFSCDHCGFQNNEIQSGAEIQPKGIKLTLTVKDVTDLNRRIVKSDYSAIRIEELDFEIPAKSQKGEVTTLEGIIERVINGLSQDQEQRRKDHPDAADQIDQFIGKLRELKEVKTEFTFILDDISGDAHIENPNAPHPDENVVSVLYNRTKEQNHLIGIYEKDELENEERNEQQEANEKLKPIQADEWPLEELHGEVLQFATNCPECHASCETNMKVTTIPHFKDVVIMATVCEACGLRTNEVKSGGGIEEKGVKIEVKVISREDFSRDVLKSETCSVAIRELDVEVGPSALGGRFTTIEGLLTAMRDQLAEQSAMFGDSADRECQNRMDRFLDQFNEVLSGSKMITVILDDPTGNSYVQALTDDDSTDSDPNLRIIHYHRSHDQNEELGLNDMKVEGYEEDS